MLKITIIALGTKMPDWVLAGCSDYIKRLQGNIAVKIIELPLLRRSKTSDLKRILEKETQVIKSTLPTNAKIIALDIEGTLLSSEALAVKLTILQQSFSHLCFLIGGPEGLDASLLQECHERWSLSKLTLPHPLVRVVLLEALYRAWSINEGHPYHR